FELPAKRWSVSIIEQTADIPDEEPKEEPITRVQSETASALRRFGGSIRDQKSKGTLRTRNGWIIGNGTNNRASTFGAGGKAAPQPTILEDSANASNIKKVDEKPTSVVQVQEIQVEDKENVAVCDSPVELNIEDSITKLQDDIAQEIESVGILLDSPAHEKDLSPTIEEVK